MSDDHSHDDMRTAMLGHFDPLEVPIILQMLDDAGIFAITRSPSDSPKLIAGHIALPSGAGDVLVEAACLTEARRLVEETLPGILSAMQDELQKEFPDR